MAAHHLLGSKDFRRDLRADIRRWVEGVMAVPLPVDLVWMEAPRDQLAAFLTDAARAADARVGSLLALLKELAGSGADHVTVLLVAGPDEGAIRNR